MKDKSSHIIDEEQINRVLGRLGTASKNYERFEKGVINPLYFIDGEDGRRFALRLTNPHWHRLKTANEFFVMNYLRENTSIPVPQILDHDLQGELIGFEYLLLERLPGQCLGEIYDTIPVQEKRSYLDQLAGYVAELKKFRFDKYGSFGEGMNIGPIADSRLGPFGTFQEYICSLIDFRLPPLGHERFGKYVPLFARYRDEVAKKYQGNVIIKLNHGDITPDNLHVNNGKINGILDWEWAIAGPADKEFYNLMEIKEWDYLQEALKKRGVQLPQGFEERKELFQVTQIATALVSYKHWNFPDEAAREKFAQDQCIQLETIFARHFAKPL